MGAGALIGGGHTRHTEESPCVRMGFLAALIGNNIGRNDRFIAIFVNGFKLVIIFAASCVIGILVGIVANGR
jgi:hypothetical protein